ADPTGVINFTEDSGLSTAPFTNVVGFAHFGPFLQFASGLVGPAPGQVGTSVAPQAISGSPCNTNIFRIEGPGLPGGVTLLETNQFDTLVGKIAHICGNGQLDLGEQCDDGNLVNGDCCSSLCLREPAGIICDDKNPCTAQTTCDGTGVC